MKRPTPQQSSLRGLTEKLGIEVAKSAFKMRNQVDKFPEVLDALKVLTTLNSVLARTQGEPEGGGIDEFARLFGGKDRVERGDRGGPALETDFDDTESTGLDGGVSGDLDGVGGPAADTPAGGERHGSRLAGD